LGVQKALLGLYDSLILSSAKIAKIKICQFSSQLAQSPAFRWKKIHSIPHSINGDIHDDMFSFFSLFGSHYSRVMAVKEVVAGSNPYAGMSFN
jgi:hypothetical protein